MKERVEKGLNEIATEILGGEMTIVELKSLAIDFTVFTKAIEKQIAKKESMGVK